MTERNYPASAGDHTPTALAERRELRRAIVSCLAQQPVEDPALRAAVWTYVGVERHEGTPPGHVIMALSGLIAAADIKPASMRQALTRRVILWGVEAYFGHLDGDVMGRDGDALSDSLAAEAPAPIARSTPTTSRSLDAALVSQSVEPRHPLTRSPLATQQAVAEEAPPFPSSSAAEPEESWHADWRSRLTRNLSRRTDGRWEPLTWFHPVTATGMG